MEQKRDETGNAAVPLYTKIGWGLAWVVMLVLVAMILRNCATSVIYGLKTEPQAVEASYQSGLADGSSGKGQKVQGGAEENSVLRKAYVKGYRDGADKGR